MELFPSLFNNSEGDKPSEFSSDEKTFSVFHSVEYQLSTIVDKISNIDNLNENEIKNIILRQHSMILNYDLFLKSEESRAYALKLFTNERFLSILVQIIGLIDLTSDEKICINKLAYDYYILDNKDPKIFELLYQISYHINNVLVIRLSGKLGINGARLLSIIANSSFKPEKNIHRINTFLVKCNIAFTVQDIVDIYCILFDTFTYPFIYTMLETKSSNMTIDQVKRFDLISVAILEILNSMTSADMKKLLFNYAYVLNLTNVNNVRFALKSARSFPRVISVIKEIESDEFENLIIP